MDGLDDKARLELEIIVKGLNESTRGLAVFSEQSDDASRATERLRKATRPLEKELAGIAGAQRDVGRATTSSTQALTKATAAQTASTDSIIAQRYALYDVATTYGIVSTALLAASGYALKVGADFESAFTSVERTSDGSARQIEAIREGLVELSTQIPLTFQDLSKIASLGNQLGIASEDILGFTETIARFAAVAGLSVDQVADSFGKISNLTGLDPSQFENLGSAIAYVARTSAATEATILSTSKEIAAIADGAGFSAEAVVGLAGALSSLSIPPERARGALSIYFSTLNKAVAEGGAGLDQFATIVGVTREQLTAMVNNGQGQQVFQRFISGISELDNVAKTTALDDLGLSAVRVDQTFQALSANTDLVSKSFDGSSDAMADGTELAAQYAKVVDDLNSQWMIFVNSVNALIAALSGGAVSGVADLLGLLTDVVTTAAQFADNPVVQFLAGLALGVGALVGVFFAYRAAVALAVASTYALTTAQLALSAAQGTGGVGAVRGLIGALLGLNAANGAATAGTTALTTAATGLGAVLRALPWVAIATLAGAAIGYIIQRTEATEEQVDSLANKLDGVAAKADTINFNGATGEAADGQKALNEEVEKYLGYLEDAAKKEEALAAVRVSGDAFDLADVGDAEDAIYQIDKLDSALAALVDAGDLAGAARIYDEIQAATEKTGDAAIIAAAQFDHYTYAVFKANAAGPAAQGSGSQLSSLLSQAAAAASAAAGLDKTAKSAGGAARQVRTLVDYASDLSGVFSRSFDIRFGGQQGIDSITGGWISIANATAEANQQIADYHAELLGLTADRAVREYWLSVAENYGDVLRAGELRAEIAKIDGDLSKTTKDLTKAQDKNSKTLTGNTEGAIDNRAQILGLVGDYQSYITALASSGLSQDQLRARTAQLKADFIAQATQLGYNNAELQVYAAAFDDVSTAIERIPRNVTVAFNGDPALLAINEFMAKAQGALGAGITIPLSVDTSKLKAAINAEIALRTAQANTARAERLFQAAAEQDAAIARLRAALGSFASGGYTGDGGKYEPKGVVHAGEFVFSKEATRNIGVSNLAYAHNMAKSGKGFSGGGFAGSAPLSGSPYLQLAPTDRQLLVDIRTAIETKPVITAGAVAGAASAVAVNQNDRRSA